MIKGEVKNNKCIECNTIVHSPYSGRCRSCYEAKYYNRKSLPQKLAERNYIEDNVGIITDSKGKRHLLSLDEFKKAKEILWSGNSKGLATGKSEKA